MNQIAPEEWDRDRFRHEVVVAAGARLRKYDWFQGVCMDSIDDYYPNDFKEAVEQAVLDTMYYDAPNHGMI